MTEKSTNKRESGKPFSGKLRPHAARILELRKTMTWQEVAEVLEKEVGIKTTAAYVCEFVGRYQKRPAPRGREIGSSPAPESEQPTPLVSAAKEGRKDPVSAEERQRIAALKTPKSLDANTPAEADPWASLNSFQSSQPLTLESKNQQPKKQ